jgi:hypothetical protein
MARAECRERLQEPVGPRGKTKRDVETGEGLVELRHA